MLELLNLTHLIEVRKSTPGVQQRTTIRPRTGVSVNKSYFPEIADLFRSGWIQSEVASKFVLPTATIGRYARGEVKMFNESVGWTQDDIDKHRQISAAKRSEQIAFNLAGDVGQHQEIVK